MSLNRQTFISTNIVETLWNIFHTNEYTTGQFGLECYWTFGATGPISAIQMFKM